MADRLLSQLNQSKTATSDRVLWQVIKELIDRIHKLENSLGIVSSTNIISNITQIQQFINQSDSGGDGDSLIIPGEKGAKGDTGATGAQGPPFPAFIFLEADDPEIPMPIPGPQGIQGPQGIPGVGGGGNTTIITEEELEEQLFQILNPSPSWELIATQTPNGTVGNYDFTNLGNYNEIIVVINAVTSSGANTKFIQVSSDNGSTFYNSAGDYIASTTAGVSTNASAMELQTTGVTAARSGYAHLFNFNGNTVKHGTSGGVNSYLLTQTSPYNAIRVAVSAGTLNAGTIYIFGRK